MLTCSHLAADAFIQSDLQMGLRTIKAYLKSLRKSDSAVQQHTGVYRKGSHLVECFLVQDNEPELERKLECEGV